MKSLSILQAREAADRVFASILDRQADPEALKYYSALLFSGELTVREMVRQLGYSNEFMERFLLSMPLPEVAHGLFHRFLGRPAENNDAAREAAARILTHGWRSQIDWFINSGEYLKKFGDEKPPA